MIRILDCPKFSDIPGLIGYHHRLRWRVRDRGYRRLLAQRMQGRPLLQRWRILKESFYQFLQIFITAMFVMGIAESLTVDRKTREIALLCKNRTIKLWAWLQPVFKLLFRGFRQFKLKNRWHFHKFQEKFQEQMYLYFLDLRLLTQRNLALELPYSTNFKVHLRSLWAFKNCSVGTRSKLRVIPFRADTLSWFLYTKCNTFKTKMLMWR